MSTSTHSRTRTGFTWWLGTLLLFLSISVATAVPDFRPAAGNGMFLPDDGGASISKTAAAPPVTVVRTYPCNGGNFTVTVTYRELTCFGGSDGSIQVNIAQGFNPAIPAFVGTPPYFVFWTGTSPVAGGPDIVAATSTRTNLVAGTYTIFIQTGDMLGACNNFADPIVVTLNQPAQLPAPGLAAAPAATVCQDAAASVQLTATLVGAPAGNYRFYNNVPPAGLVQNGPGNTFNVSRATPGTFTYYVDFLPSDPGCVPSFVGGPFTVTVNPSPTAPPVPVANPATPCIGANFTLTVNPATQPTYNWYTVPVAGAPVATGNPATFTAVAGPNTYWVAAVGANGCEGPRTQVTVNSATPPAAPADYLHRHSGTAGGAAHGAIPLVRRHQHAG